MSLPGFAADAALYRTRKRYQHAWASQTRAEGIHPAVVNQGCFDACYSNCNWACFELIGSARAGCLRERRDCTTLSAGVRGTATRAANVQLPSRHDLCGNELRDLLALASQFHLLAGRICRFLCLIACRSPKS